MANFNDYKYDDDQDGEIIKSLCYVEGSDGFTVRRLADLEEGRFYRLDLENISDQRAKVKKLPQKKNSPFEMGLGIFQWKPEPNLNDPNKTFYRIDKSQETPILICPAPSVRNVDEIKEGLKVGMPVKAKGNIRILFVPNQAYYNLSGGTTDVEGALCSLDECACEDRDGAIQWKLKPETARLPIYKITSRQTLDFKCADAQLRFLNYLNVGTPVKYIAVKTPKEICLDVARESWVTVVNTTKDIRRFDKPEAKKYFNNMPVETIIEKIARRCKCSSEEASKYWEETRRYIAGWIEAEADDIKVFVEFLERNDKLREDYYNLWLGRLTEQLEAEEEKNKERREAAEKELQDVLEEKKRVEKERDALIDAKERLNGEIKELQLENERKKNALRQIERELSEAIRREWSAAEENAAEFWAKKVVFSTETRRDGANQCDDGKNVRKSSLFTPGVALSVGTEKNDKASFGKALAERLEKQIESDFVEELAAFLIAGFARREPSPLILAGPCGDRVAEALAAVRGRRPGTLRCDGDWNEDAVAYAEGGDDEIILVKNALNPRWVDRWPDAVAESSKRWILTTLFAEDLTLLPQGFYNYFTPVLTDILVGKVDGEEAGESETWDSAEEETKGSKFKFDDKSFVKMRANSFYCNRLEETLKRAYQVGQKEFQFDDKSQTRLTLLFGVAPFAFATGNLDVLRKAFEWEKEELDGKCRETIRRLLGDAEE